MFNSVAKRVHPLLSKSVRGVPVNGRVQCIHYQQRRTFAATNSEPVLVHYDCFGDEADRSKPPILIMHGLFGSKRNNRAIGKQLQKDLERPVYALDLRNHGDSPHTSVHTYEAMAGDVEHFLQEHNLKDATLLGHSMGAKVAMTVAIRSPDMIQDIIAVDNAPVNAQLGAQFARYVQAMKKIEAAGVAKQSEADAILKEIENDISIRHFLLTNLYRPNDPKTGKHVHDYKWRIPVRTLGASLDELASFPFRPGSSARFEKPALFVRGTKSKYVADETIPLIGEFFPRFQLKDVEAGHWVISENPEGFKEVALEFLRRDKD